MNLPPILPGDTHAQSAHNALVKAVKSLRPMRGTGVQTMHTAFGVSRKANPGRAARPSLLQLFRITAVQGDYLTCRTWDGTNLGGADILVAKPENLRASLAAENVDGVALTYNWAFDDGSGNTRVCYDGTYSETQVCFPRYIYYTQAGNVAANNQDVIRAGLFTGPTGVATVDDAGQFWCELKPARVWAKKYGS